MPLIIITLEIVDQSCAMKQKHALLSGRTVFFAVQPKFMNVNIRITLDVTHGSINVYLSPKDDTFVIKQENWVHRVWQRIHMYIHIHGMV